MFGDRDFAIEEMGQGTCCRGIRGQELVITQAGILTTVREERQST
jgi:hypothetical protein